MRVGRPGPNRRPDVVVHVLDETEDFLAVAKPAGIPTTAPGGGPSLVARVTASRPSEKLHPSSRLDADVSGIVVFCRTALATATLLEARRHGAYARVYVGLAATPPAPANGRWTTALALDPRDPRSRRAVVAPSGRERGLRDAATDYESVAVGAATVLLLSPVTGRTHQLRVHAAHAGAPLLGDVRYGGAPRRVLSDGRVVAIRRVALHCARVEVPTSRGGRVRFVSPLPADLQAVVAALGGTPAEVEVLADRSLAGRDRDR